MDSILLRTMTWKSKFTGGKYDGCTVQQLFDANNRRYLRHCYFCYSKISFIDEVLDKIGVPDFLRIEKPGVNQEYFARCNQYNLDKVGGITKIKIERLAKLKARLKVKDSIPLLSKRYLQSINHGR